MDKESQSQISVTSEYVPSTQTNINSQNIKSENQTQEIINSQNIIAYGHQANNIQNNVLNDAPLEYTTGPELNNPDKFKDYLLSNGLYNTYYAFVDEMKINSNCKPIEKVIDDYIKETCRDYAKIVDYVK
jgi:hypothetical protein